MRRCVTALLAAALVGCLAPWAAAGDTEQAQQIAERLRGSGKLKGYSIGVTCDSGTVHLRGQVASKQQMDQAVAMTRKMPGVSQVVNELSISGSGGARPAAATMAAARRRQDSTPIPVQTLPQGTVVEEAIPLESSVPGRMYQGAPIYQGGGSGGPIPMQTVGPPMGAAPMAYDNPRMPDYAWPSYAAYPNYAGVSYPRQYSPSAWPYIGPFYPYPQVPLGWRKVTLEWDDGWWFLDFHDGDCDCY